MAQDFSQYDPKEVQVIVGGNPITGYADGTFVVVDFDEQSWNKATGADGHVGRAKSNNFGGTITITLMATSNGNDILSALWNRDRRDNGGVVNILVKDALGTTIWSAAQAWIQKLPEQSFSKDIEEREWVFDCANLVGVVGGNQAA